jgi:hypothetical protein
MTPDIKTQYVNIKETSKQLARIVSVLFPFIIIVSACKLILIQEGSPVRFKLRQREAMVPFNATTGGPQLARFQSARSWIQHNLKIVLNSTIPRFGTILNRITRVFMRKKCYLGSIHKLRKHVWHFLTMYLSLFAIVSI